MFKDLSLLEKELVDKIESYKEQLSIDCELPEDFKKETRVVDNNTILYTKFGFRASATLDIYFPNQLWYLAAICVPLYNEVVKYGDAVKNTFDKDSIKNCKDSLSLAKTIVSNSTFSQEDKELLVKFLYDYKWWKGGKTIDRTDYFHSPILATCNLVNASQDYVADMCKYLSSKPDALKKLNEALVNLPIPERVYENIVESTKTTQFLTLCVKEFLSFDKNMSLLTSSMKFNTVTIGFPGFQLGKKKVAQDAIVDPRRIDDCDKSIVWEAKGEFYYLWKEQTSTSIQTFADNINLLYKPFYQIVVSDDKYILRRLVCPVQSTVDSSRIPTPPRKIDLPLQQIFYGAPGTGKSFKIDKDTNESNRIRTTFHPDYDYATFVGAYKPTVKKVDRYGLFGKDTVVMMHEDNTPVKEDVIVYKFIPQSFTKAYVEAWRRFANPECTDKNYYLVIEEINRGNCAQIFGDLFQLLDRTSGGYSSYAVETDTDLQQFLTSDEEWKLNITLTEDIKNDEGHVIAKAKDVMSGKVLVLPPNLHIWATMNTSDQSLFPIDSAFKRRWDWRYVPIKYDNNDWKVVLEDGSWCLWTELQQTLNDLIYDATESEDKMLGDWFVKADDKNEINEEQLVGKIIFYLWNDVAKVDAGKLFDLEVEKRGRTRKLIFSDFYTAEGKINSEVVKNWLKNNEVAINDLESVNEEENEGDEDSDESRSEHVSDTNMPYRVTFPDGEVICNGNGWDTYIAALRKIGLDKALPYGEIFHRKNKTLPLITTKRIPDDGIYKYHDVDGYFVLSGTDSQHRLLKRMSNDLNLGLTIE